MIYSNKADCKNCRRLLVIILLSFMIPITILAPDAAVDLLLSTAYHKLLLFNRCLNS